MSMGSVGRDAFYARYSTEIQTYSDIASYVKTQLNDIANNLGIPAHCEYRVKDIGSLWTKFLRKQKTGYRYEDIKDKAGSRIVVTYPEHVDLVRTHLEELFPGVVPDDKSVSLGTDRLGYLGIHWDIPFPNNAWPIDTQIDDAYCEVQLQTQAQRLWSDLNHDLIYKPEDGHIVSLKLDRRVKLLSGLCELVDIEFQTIKDMMANDESPAPVRLLGLLNEYRHRYSSQKVDTELSLTILEKLVSLYEDGTDLRAVFDGFINEFDQRLSAIFEDQAKLSERNALVFQPEAILIFERLEHGMERLRHAWIEVMPYQELERLSAVWGRPVPALG